MVTVGVLLTYLIEREVVWAETTRVGTDKQVIALAGAKRIESFFERIAVDLRILSLQENPHSIDSPPNDFALSRRIMEEAVDSYENTPLVNFLRVDSEGKVVISVKRERTILGEGTDISDRDYFVWAKGQNSEGTVFLSGPFQARVEPLRGESVVTIAMPILVRGGFDGVLLGIIDTEKLLTDYVVSLVPYEGADVMIVNQDGTVIIGMLQQDLVGKSLSEVFSGKPVVFGQTRHERVINDILSGKNSWSELVDRFNGKGAGKQWIVGFAPVRFDGQRWSLITMVTQVEAFGRIEKYRRYLQLSLLFTGFGVVAIGVVSILSIRKAQLVWYKKGFHLARYAKRRVFKAVGIDGQKREA